MTLKPPKDPPSIEGLKPHTKRLRSQRSRVAFPELDGDIVQPKTPKILKEKKKEYLKERERLQKKKEWIKQHDETLKVLDPKSKSKVVSADIEALVPEVRDPLKKRDVIWQPNSKVQIEFLSSTEDEVLFSGGRGSGKSDCLLVDPLRYISNRNFRGLIIRRTMPELRELIQRAKDIYVRAVSGTRWKEQEKLFEFPSGARVEFGYCDNEDDLERYRGQQYTWLGIDEITQFADENSLDVLKASLRTTDPTLPVFIRATTNPSGAGCRWVKSRWVDHAPPGKRIELKYKVKDREYTISRKWFNSTIYDNPDLLDNNPNYVASLASIGNEAKRKQWLEGSWDAVEGLAFDEFNRSIHVVDPFPIPRNWFKFRCCDFGYGSMSVCLWIATDYDGTAYVYREYASNNPMYQTGKQTAEVFASNVLSLEKDETIRYGILDSSVWAQRGQVGETPAETMINMGCNWIPSDRSSGTRVSGKMLVHQYLSLDPDTGNPKIKIFSNCVELIKEFSSLPLDRNNPEDVDTKACDHAYDALRYGLSSRPIFAKTYSDMFRSYDPKPVLIDSFFGY